MKKPNLVLYFLYMALACGLRMAAYCVPFMDDSLVSLIFALLCILGVIWSVRIARFYKEISLNRQWLFILLSWLYGFWTVVSLLMALMNFVGRYRILHQ